MSTPAKPQIETTSVKTSPSPSYTTQVEKPYAEDPQPGVLDKLKDSANDVGSRIQNGAEDTRTQLTDKQPERTTVIKERF